MNITLDLSMNITLDLSFSFSYIYFAQKLSGSRSKYLFEHFYNVKLM